MPSYKSPLKTVGGGEGDRCNYPVRLDTYGRGCSHDCAYCYAKSLLDFRGLWGEPAAADINKIRRKIAVLRPGLVVRLGGMTDCFQECEEWHRVTYRTIKSLNRKKVHYLIVTKSPLVARPDYLEIMDKDLAHIQVTVTSTDDSLNKTYEKAPPYSERKKAIETLAKEGFDVSVRLSPYIPEYIDTEKLAGIECDKILVEFLRANHWIRKAFPVDYSDHVIKEGGYDHLPLYRKIELLEGVKGFDQVTVCEDVTEHYEFFRDNINHNRNDCCNLRGLNA